MNQQQIEQAAALLVGARRGGVAGGTAGGCRPASVTDAHAIQDAVTAASGQAGRRVQGEWRRPMASRRAG